VKLLLLCLCLCLSGCATHTCNVQVHDQNARNLDDEDGTGDEASDTVSGPDIKIDAKVPITP
jgi:hypothetical protein